MSRTRHHVKWLGVWWRVPRWFFDWHYMRHHRRAFGLTKRQHRELLQSTRGLREDFAKTYPVTLDEAVEKLRAYPYDPAGPEEDRD